MLNQRAFLNIKRLAERATIMERNIRGTAFWAKNNFIEEFLFQDSGVVEFA
jgi:hypothetical protein